MNNLKFLKILKGENGQIEISDLKKNLGGLDKYDELVAQGGELYFVTFIPNGTRYTRKKYETLFRTSDHHVAGTNCFKVDFDLRANAYKETGKVISNDELFSYLPKLKEGLSSSPLLADYTAIVFSGNGFHFYWQGKKPVYISSENYYGAAKIILKKIKSIFENDPILFPDEACTNIARLMRLPGTKNQKSKYGLPPQNVEVIELIDGDSELVSKLPELGKMFYEHQKKRIEQEYLKVKNLGNGPCGLEKCTATYGLFGDGCRLYYAINHDINISNLVCKYTGWKPAGNGKNFISQNDGGFTGAFVDKERNIVVRAGTPHISDTYPVYSPFAFLLVHYADGDAHKVFEMAKEWYPNLSHSKPKYFYGRGLLTRDDRK